MKVVAIEPIKMNNERLPGKNIMELCGKPLLQYSLEYLDKAKMIDQIYIFCSDDIIKKYLVGKAQYLRRPKSLDLPSSNFNQIFEAFRLLVEADIYVYAHATAPFIKVETVNQCVEAVVSGKYDSAFCAQKIQDFLWKDGEPLNFDSSNLPRSQDLESIYRETSGIYVFKREVFEKYHRRIGIKPYVREVTTKEAVDINNLEDFLLAEAIVNLSI